jgi:hypothetical protein
LQTSLPVQTDRLGVWCAVADLYDL